MLICRTDSETKKMGKWEQSNCSINRKKTCYITIHCKTSDIYIIQHCKYVEKKDTRQGNVISITPVSVENLKAKNNIFVNNS